MADLQIHSAVFVVSEDFLKNCLNFIQNSGFKTSELERKGTEMWGDSWLYLPLPALPCSAPLAFLARWQTPCLS